MLLAACLLCCSTDPNTTGDAALGGAATGGAGGLGGAGGFGGAGGLGGAGGSSGTSGIGASGGVGGSAGIGGSGGVGGLAPDGGANDGGIEPMNGLRLDYFRDLRELTHSAIDPVVDHDFESAGPAPGQPRQAFSMRWSGSIVPRYSETYTLEVRVDDGARLFIDGALVAEDWALGGARIASATIELTADQEHAIALEYFQLDGGAVVQLFWSSASQARELVPTERLIAAAADPSAQAPARPSYMNPVVANDWPDPGVLAIPGEGETPTTYYLVSTGGSFPIRRSLDLVHWTDAGASVMPAGKAPWAPDGGRNWAPELHRIGGKFLAYYTSSASATPQRNDALAIGVAWADDVLGPYEHASQPLVPAGSHGTIDATAFVDAGGTPYLYWKTDGNCCGVKTGIWVRELAADGRSFVAGSTGTLLIENVLEWEAHVIEAPWVIQRGSYYYLFYSADSYLHPYKTGVARSASAAGPFEKFGPPILTQNDSVQGPGHGSVLLVGDEHVFVHHGWMGDDGRYVFVSPITWDNDWPKIADGTTPLGPLSWP